jgi:hypothetical protein
MYPTKNSRMKQTIPPSIVLCAGLKSSGSTWLYNVAIELCRANARARRNPRRRVVPFYAETVEQFPPGSERAGLLVVKTHIPSASLIFLTRFTGGTVFLTVREPRDSVASLMQRFGHRFEPCVKEVSAGAERMVELVRVARPLVMRYEDRFFERPETIPRIADRLGLPVEKATSDRIFRKLSAEQVRKTITALTSRGIFGTRPDPDRFDPSTHWHPRHVGDGKTGKYAETLTAKMQRAVLESMREYCVVFGYETAIRSPRQKPRAAKHGRRRPGYRGSSVAKSNRLS